MEEHKKLIDYLPPFLAEYREYKRLFGVLQDEEDSILYKTDRALEDTYVPLTDIYGVERWEKMLGIVPNAEETLEERQDAIRFKMAGMRPITMRKLKEILDITIGSGEYTAEITDDYTLTVRIALTSSFRRAAVTRMLRKLVPANILLDVDLRYNRHQDFINILKHGEMAAHTHQALREETINE